MPISLLPTAPESFSHIPVNALPATAITTTSRSRHISPQLSLPYPVAVLRASPGWLNLVLWLDSSLTPYITFTLSPLSVTSADARSWTLLLEAA